MAILDQVFAFDFPAHPHPIFFKLRWERECTDGPVGCGDTPVNHFTASGVHAQQGNAAESQEREMHAGHQHTPSGHSLRT